MGVDTVSMGGSRKFYQRGSKFDNVLLVDEGIEDPNITKWAIIGLSGKRHVSLAG